MTKRNAHEVAGLTPKYENGPGQLVGAGRERQAVLLVEMFLVATIPPRFTVAGHQVDGVVNPRDPASPLDPYYALFEQALPATAS